MLCVKKKQIEELKNLAKEVRQDSFLMINRAKEGHYASAMSSVEIILALYLGGILHYDTENPANPERDRFLLSKGQAAAALYSVLSKAGLISEAVLDTYCVTGSEIGASTTEFLPFGIEMSGGSLGHGLGLAGGIALSGKLDERKYKTYVMIGDGECQEGSIWEAAMAAAHFKLDNLTAIVDWNGLQASGCVKDIIDLNDLEWKWKSFGWKTDVVNGHEIEEIIQSLEKSKFECGRPHVILSRTVKGRGIKFMENSVDWHYRIMNNGETRLAKEDLGIEKK